MRSLAIPRNIPARESCQLNVLHSTLTNTQQLVTGDRFVLAAIDSSQRIGAIR